MFAGLPWNALNDGLLQWDSPQVEEHIEEILWKPWFEDREGYLYIVGEDEIFGPDNEMADKIGRALDEGVMEEFVNKYIEGLEYVPHVLRRFNPQDGFYHA